MKVFAISDVHSFYTIMKETLDKAGFEQNNPEHLLVVCGDCFDRGLESYEVLKYLMSTDNKVIIKGNHDILFDDLVDRGYPKSHDKHNGTINTVIQLGRLNDEDPYHEFDIICQNANNRLAEYKHQLVNYFETENYIFVHSWIPVKYECRDGSDIWGIPQGKVLYDPDWRKAPEVSWEEAMWGNPFTLAKLGLNKTGKTIVFGHFHTSWAHARDKGVSEFGDDAIWDIYRNEKQKIIGLDRCTYYTGEMNVLILEDDLMKGKNND